MAQREQDFDSSIAPLVDALHDACAQRGIPMFAVFVLDQDEEGQHGCVFSTLGSEEEDSPIYDASGMVLKATRALIDDWEVLDPNDEEDWDDDDDDDEEEDESV